MLGLNFGLVTLIMFVAIIVFILSGMRIIFAMMIVGMLSLFLFTPRPMTDAAGPAIFRVLNSLGLVASVLFILMGEFLMRGRLGEEVYRAMERWFYRFPGGLAQVNIAACTLFAAISGSSVANAATMGIVAGPLMEQRGYSQRLIYGSIAGGGTLGILIPPSVLMIIYGALAQVSVGQLFIAGIIPGLVAAALFMVVVAGWATASPSAAPAITERFSWKQRWFSLVQLVPITILILAILGGIYAGVTTPTEAAAVGCITTLAILAVKKRLTWRLVRDSTMETLYIAGAIHLIVAGSSVIAWVVHALRIPVLFTQVIMDVSLSPYLVYVLVCFMYLILGMFIDGISMIVITVPIVVPLLTTLGFDPVWIGIIATICAELALITPPVGMNLYVLKGVARHVELMEIAAGAAPFVVVLIFMLALLAVFPQLALWLPGKMF